MRGTRAKKLRNSIKGGNPLQREDRLYQGVERLIRVAVPPSMRKTGEPAVREYKSVQVLTTGARRVYRVLKALHRGQHPQHGVGV